MEHTPKSWEAWLAWAVEQLAGLLRGEATKDALRQAGAGPDAMVGAVKVDLTLPTFGGHNGPPPGLEESRDLAHAHPELRRRYLALKADFEATTGRQLHETCTYRSPKIQQALYKKGRRGIAGERKVTNVDGVTTKGRHNVYPSQAIDTCVDVDPGPGKAVVWDLAAYAPLGPLARKHGLRWGGDWDGDGSSADERFIDAPHLELPAGAV